MEKERIAQALKKDMKDLKGRFDAFESRAKADVEEGLRQAGEDAELKIIQQPIKAVGAAFGVGVAVGLLTSAFVWSKVRAES